MLFRSYSSGNETQPSNGVARKTPQNGARSPENRRNGDGAIKPPRGKQNAEYGRNRPYAHIDHGRGRGKLGQEILTDLPPHPTRWKTGTGDRTTGTGWKVEAERTHSTREEAAGKHRLSSVGTPHETQPARRPDPTRTPATRPPILPAIRPAATASTKQRQRDRARRRNEREPKKKLTRRQARTFTKPPRIPATQGGKGNAYHIIFLTKN